MLNLDSALSPSVCRPREQTGFTRSFRNQQTNLHSLSEVTPPSSAPRAPSETGQDGLKCKMTEREVVEEIKRLGRLLLFSEQM